jgi:hypothetical protein
MPLTAEDRLAIVELDARALHAWDYGSVDDWVGTFTDDALCELQWHHAENTVLRGRKELAGFYERAHANWGAIPETQHWHTNHLIEGDGDTASHRCYHIMLRVVDGVPTVRSMGVSYNLLENTDDGWKYTHAKIVFDFPLS